jgi:hypothetical protein
MDTISIRPAAPRWPADPLDERCAADRAARRPRYVLAELRTPGFLQYFLMGEHWHRFVTPGWTGDLSGKAHAFPRGSIWPFAIAACLP